MVGKAQAKILFIVCYYIVTGTLFLIPLMYYQVTEEAAIQAVSRYFVCQSTGIQSGRDCGEVSAIYLAVFDSLSTLGIILICLLPAVVLIFTVKCTKCNCNIKWCK